MKSADHEIQGVAAISFVDRKGLSPMDIVAILTKVVQEQQKRIAELEARLDGKM